MEGAEVVGYFEAAARHYGLLGQLLEARARSRTIVPLPGSAANRYRAAQFGQTSSHNRK